jgi:hypothetical protein
VVSILLLSLLLTTASAQPADTLHCVAAGRFVRETQQMTAVIERDSIDDWRTGQRVAGCRITAAGATEIGVQREAVRFYERVRAAGWTRTPDPRDAPTEASLRFRWAQSDCLFNIAAEAMLGTKAERLVNGTVVIPPGQVRYQLLVQCMPAMPAKPRGEGAT